MSSLTRVKVRASIVGGGISAQTPFVKSFNVRKTRGQAGSFSCSVKVPADSVGSLRGQIQIMAGSPTANNLIFTGVITKATISPAFDDPSYVIINMSGTDVLKTLEHKKYTRRQMSSLACWCEITGVTRKKAKSGKFQYMRNLDTMVISDGEMEQDSSSVQTTDIANSQMVKSIGTNVQTGQNPSSVPLTVDIMTGEEGVR